MLGTLVSGKLTKFPVDTFDIILVNGQTWTLLPPPKISCR